MSTGRLGPSAPRPRAPSRSRVGTRAWTVAVLVIVATLCLGIGRAGAAGLPPQYTPTGGQEISVLGSHLLRGGVPWIPRGVQIVGLVAPDGALSGKYVDANAHYSSDELSKAVAAHADTIRFQVSQFGLDPQDPMYSPAYVRQIEQAVATARRLGLAVIVSIQAEPPAGRYGRCPMPDAGTARVWDELAPAFANDPGVMFELYNEPGISASATGWEKWRDGGIVFLNSGVSCQGVGMQTLVDSIRADGANNVIIVPGLKGEQTVAGMLPLSDPSNPYNPQLAYGIHYPSLGGGIPRWEHAFGRLSAQYPIVVTEWDSNSTHDCIPDAPDRATLLLDYLASKEIGIVGFAFDLPGTIINDWSYLPTTYRSFACGVPGGGPGEVLFQEYAAMGQAGGLLHGDVPAAWIVSAGVVRRLAVKHPSLAQHYFNSPRTYVTGAGSTALARLGLPAAIPTAGFTDERTLARAVNHGTLRRGTRAVIFNDAAGAPRAQQMHPGIYFERAAHAAHQHGLLLIAAQSTELVAASKPRGHRGQTYSRFLRQGVASAAARHADVYVLQPQPLASGGAKNRGFLQSVSTQVASAHPGIELMAGLSTSVQASRPAAQVLLNAILQTRSFLAGYWLQPSARAHCLACTGPYPNLLRLLNGAG